MWSYLPLLKNKCIKCKKKKTFNKLELYKLPAEPKHQGTLALKDDFILVSF